MGHTTMDSVNQFSLHRIYRPSLCLSKIAEKLLGITSQLSARSKVLPPQEFSDGFKELDMITDYFSDSQQRRAQQQTCYSPQPAEKQQDDK
ncbi:hypothetical protein SAMN05216387_102331 [Nitrosovibrio tenuis]|uniref:Uncharacterized protein n=1 Tax=Nitrosovibrio tenuis TaxID=1233 RepID=A0A1H7J023_9PROT|nr:hypothetical protein SAMN05216387_102331 [Nitrosovibrio tenuis]